MFKKYIQAPRYSKYLGINIYNHRLVNMTHALYVMMGKPKFVDFEVDEKNNKIKIYQAEKGYKVRDSVKNKPSTKYINVHLGETMPQGKYKYVEGINGGFVCELTNL